MARYLLLGKYTDEALAKIRGDGFRTRPERNKEVFEALGGDLLCMYFMAAGAGAWDFCGIVECSSDDLASITLQSVGTGTFERVESHEIRTGEEMDALAGRTTTWAAPGQSR